MSNSTIKNVRIKPDSKRSSCSASIRKNRGFTILEAIIGFLVLSIGMLGVASLQGVSLKAGKTSVYASVAMMKAEELLEGIRANSTAVNDYTGAGMSHSCTTNDCTPTQLAQDDLYWWGENFKAGLPSSASGLVTVTDPVVGSKIITVTVTVSWNERNKDKSGASSAKRTFATTASICTEIPC